MLNLIPRKVVGTVVYVLLNAEVLPCASHGNPRLSCLSPTCELLHHQTMHKKGTLSWNFPAYFYCNVNSHLNLYFLYMVILAVSFLL